MRKALVVLLATLFVVTAAWAQSYTPNADPLLGPHNVNNMGCMSCHAPHNAVLQGEGGFLWARAVPLKSYTTYGGGALDTSQTYLQYNAVTGGNSLSDADDPATHTVLCLSCHDTTFSGMTLTNPVNGVVASDGTTLNYNHPVHVAYPTTAEFWKVTVSNGSASFVDSTGTTFQYGHPARLFVATGSTTPYVECGSCHNPHQYNDIVVTQNGAKVAVKTAHFVRGQYDNLANQQNFCVSCHADKSGQWNGTGAQ